MTPTRYGKQKNTVLKLCKEGKYWVGAKIRIKGCTWMETVALDVAPMS